MQKYLAAVFAVLLLAGCGEDSENEPSAPRVDDICDAPIDLEALRGYLDQSCSDQAAWTEADELAELEVLALVNYARSYGGTCTSSSGESQSFPPSQSLAFNGALTCAARGHSTDMADRGFFDHTNPSGQDVCDRVVAEGYLWSMIGENLAIGQDSPCEAVKGWLESYPHCLNVYEPDFRELGVGFVSRPEPYPGDSRILGRYWTQNFGTEGPANSCR